MSEQVANAKQVDCNDTNAVKLDFFQGVDLKRHDAFRLPVTKMDIERYL